MTHKQQGYLFQQTSGEGVHLHRKPVFGATPEASPETHQGQSYRLSEAQSTYRIPTYLTSHWLTTMATKWIKKKCPPQETIPGVHLAATITTLVAKATPTFSQYPQGWEL